MGRTLYLGRECRVSIDVYKERDIPLLWIFDPSSYQPFPHEVTMKFTVVVLAALTIVSVAQSAAVPTEENTIAREW